MATVASAAPASFAIGTLPHYSRGFSHPPVILAENLCSWYCMLIGLCSLPCLCVPSYWDLLCTAAGPFLQGGRGSTLAAAVIGSELTGSLAHAAAAEQLVGATNMPAAASVADVVEDPMVHEIARVLADMKERMADLKAHAARRVENSST